MLLLLVIALRRGRRLSLWTGRAVLLLAAASMAFAAPALPRQVTALLVLDRFALFLLGLLLALALTTSLLSHFATTATPPEEFHLLLLLATLGGGLLVASSHLSSLLLGLETLSVSLFGLIAYRRERRGAEAGLKYLVLSGASLALLLFGAALLYASLGTTGLAELGALRRAAEGGPLFPAGLALLAVGICFKLGLAPFHMWTADVYQGAPAPVTAFVATASKAAVFALLLRFFLGLGADRQPRLLLAFIIIAGLSMVAGNLLALLQTNVKRLLAYSSIAHLGYLLLAFLNGGRLGLEAAAYYLVAYSVTVFGAFAVVAVLSGPAAIGGDGWLEAEDLEDYRGLYWRRPLLAALLTACLLSLAGIPLTAGFIGKLYVLAAGVQRARWVLALLLVLTSAIGLFYYLRVVVIMFSPWPAGEPTRPVARLPLGAALLLGALGLVVLWLGVLPGPLQVLIRLAVTRPL